MENKRVKIAKQSAISYHLVTCNCSIFFDDFTILPVGSNNFNLLIKKSQLIAHDNSVMKKAVKSFNESCLNRKFAEADLGLLQHPSWSAL